MHLRNAAGSFQLQTKVWRDKKSFVPLLTKRQVCTIYKILTFKKICQTFEVFLEKFCLKYSQFTISCISGIQQSDSCVFFPGSFPLEFINYYGAQFSVLHSRSFLVIYLNSVYVNPTLLTYPSPLLSPLVTTSLVSVSFSLFLFWK